MDEGEVGSGPCGAVILHAPTVIGHGLGHWSRLFLLGRSERRCGWEVAYGRFRGSGGHAFQGLGGWRELGQSGSPVGLASRDCKGAGYTTEGPCAGLRWIARSLASLLAKTRDQLGTAQVASRAFPCGGRADGVRFDVPEAPDSTTGWGVAWAQFGEPARRVVDAPSGGTSMEWRTARRQPLVTAAVPAGSRAPAARAPAVPRVGRAPVGPRGPAGSCGG